MIFPLFCDSVALVELTGLFERDLANQSAEEPFYGVLGKTCMGNHDCDLLTSVLEFRAFYGPEYAIGLLKTFQNHAE